MIISLIVAVSLNGVIGNNNKLIWNLPDDLKYFRKKTLGHPVIMGRKTFDSIGKPLPNRKSIILTRNTNLNYENVDIVRTVDEAINLAKISNKDEVFIIGGSEIYQLFLPIVNKIYLTLVKEQFVGDSYFILPDMKMWKEINRIEHKIDNNHLYEFDFVKLIRLI